MAEKSLKKNAFYSVLKVFLSLVFPLITFPYASRILLPEGIGKINYANNIISYFIMIASLGIGGYATREASKVRNDKKLLTKLFKEIITINLFCCITAYILFFISLSVIPKFDYYKDLLLVCSIKILFSVLGIDWVYTANEDFKYITIRSFFIQLFSLFYLFIFVKTKNDLIQYAIFGILTSVGCNIFNFFRVGKYIDLRIKVKLEFKKHFKPIFVFFGITIVTSIYTMLDTTMLGHFSNNTEIGFYAASTKLGHMVLSLLTAITGILLPRLTSLINKEDKSSFNELITKSANILLLLSVPMTFGLIILAKPLILLLSGENYLPAVKAMQVIAPIIIFISFGSLTGVQILPALGKERISFYSYICGAITNITLNSIFIPKFGAMGAAIGTVFAEFIVMFVQILYLRKILRFSFYGKSLIESLIASLFMIIIIYFLLKVINNLIISLILSVLFGVFIYSVTLYTLKNNYFIFYFNKFFKKGLKK